VFRKKAFIGLSKCFSYENTLAPLSNRVVGLPLLVQNVPLGWIFNPVKSSALDIIEVAPICGIKITLISTVLIIYEIFLNLNFTYLATIFVLCCYIFFW